MSVELRLNSQAEPLRAFGRVSVGPPAFAPDSLAVRTVADDLEQMLLGPNIESSVPSETVRRSARDIIHRALETVRLMNTDAMNAGGMAGHDSRLGRLREPIFSPVTRAAYATVSVAHTAILEALQGLEAQPGTPERARAVGALQQMIARLRPYDQGGDLSNTARRQMPAMMRGSDGVHLALTRRQRNTVQRAIDDAGTQAPTPSTPEAAMRSLITGFSSFAILHSGVDVGNNHTLNELFADPSMILDYLRRGKAQGNIVPAVRGQPLVVPGNPDASAFIALISNPNHPMNAQFTNLDPVTNKTGIQIAREWISSLQP